MEKDQNKKALKEFGLSSLSINNSTSVFILTAIIVVFGMFSYSSMPKEQFPEIQLPMVYVNTIYPGNSPVDIENLITRPIEKELKSVKGVKEIKSTSAQDVSVIIVEFNEDVEVSKALQDTKDAVDKSKKELPTDLDTDPSVMEMDFTEIPVVVVNLSGDFEIDKLQEYAEYLEDEFEELSEVSRVDIAGSVEREIQINVDLFKMDAMKVSFGDIEQAVANENISMSGGDVLTDGFRRSLRVTGEFSTAEELKNIIVKSEKMNTIYLKDLAEVNDTYEERKSYARLATSKFATEGANPVISLNVLKRGGENLIEATKKVNAILDKAKTSGQLPSNLDIVLTQSQAEDMKKQIDNLENSIISGVILVVMVLMFFMGLRNALLVGMAIPLSMFMAFMLLSMMGITVNMVVLFALILALGMLVDNAIVIIENIYRLREEGYNKEASSKEGAGEVAMAIISSTATTLAAFVPLAFWGGIMGEFMKYLPITLIVVLASSLFVGLIINPVMAKAFMKISNSPIVTNKQRNLIIAAVTAAFAFVFYFIGETYTMGNLLMFFALMGIANIYLLRPGAYWFQNVLLVRIEELYLGSLKFALKGFRPYAIFGGTFIFLFAAVGLFGSSEPETLLFPENEPRNVFMYIDAPLGTDVEETNRMTKEVEAKLYKELAVYSPIIESIVTNVGENTGDPQEPMGGGQVTPHKSKITLTFVPFEDRFGISTAEVLKVCSNLMKEIPGLKVVTDKERNGPPTGKPINIEIKGEDYEVLIAEAEKMKAKIEQSGIEGIDKLGIDINVGKPEMLVNIDRNKARRFGVSTGLIASNLRTAIYGKEISQFKDGDDDHPIMLRMKDEYRYNISSLNDQRITFRDNQGQFHQVPISSVANLEYSSTVGEVKRIDLDRVVVLSSNITEGYNPNSVVSEVQELMSNEKLPEGYSYEFTGEQEEQAKSMEFLSRAMMIAVCAIFLILVSQFNSFSKPFIIMMSVLFSLIGVFLGLFVFKDPFVIIMTGIGIISLAGVVVNNAIVLIDYTDLLIKRKKKELGMEEGEELEKLQLIDCIVQAGFTRLRPVLLTAITTVLGLIPLATGLNIDFFGLFASFEPNIFMGGENADMWGPMAWTVIYGLVFATFLTLIVVPVMFLLITRLSNWVKGLGGKKKASPSIDLGKA
ncbi:efflux RND transporter permease subunit [Sediminitomix flava]|uniref:Multidrug efflux pump subunit AcrB n=1 Tax=Sediminitomix flava TaxID=379075 RepID=A0A315YX40_SEDFL|nr:efflux RND transporter permease subunit [Sediminitomix flava]PWJ34213.1 multidrug efflux pump subunit AcrB [Sediminitomix flava]